MKIKFSVLFICIFFGPFHFLYGQNSDADMFFKLINSTKNLSSMSCELKYEIYTDIADSEPEITSSGVYIVEEKRYSYSLGKEKVIKNGNAKLTISFDDKKLFLQDDYQDISPDIGSKLNEFIKSNVNITLVSDIEGIQKYEIKIDQETVSPFELMVVEFDTKLKFYRKIQLDYKEVKGVSEYAKKNRYT